MSAIDLFAGPGGWDLAAEAHGLHPLGIELDDSACATRTAAGLCTLQADVAELDPADFAPCHGLIASPPCQAFSMAGKGAGRGGLNAYLDAIEAMSRGETVDVTALDEACGDPRGHLVLEPLRWALALTPRWIALEQVPPVLPLWEAMAGVLRDKGYGVATAILSAEQYGVPQTRKRAFLLASLDGSVWMPQPTHQRYIALRSRDDEGGGMFDLPDAERVVHREDHGLLPWVSMAQALGWQEGPSPSPSVTGGGGATGGVEVFASKAARARAAGAVIQTNNFTAVQRDPDGRRSKNGSIAYTRPVDDPAPTLGGRVDLWEVLRPTHYDRRQQSGGAPVPLISVDEPAPTITAQGLARGRDVWVTERPAPTIRVTLAEALTLQSFPPDYPVQGTKSKQYEQVGNAVPPLLAWHVLSAVVHELKAAA